MHHYRKTVKHYQANRAKNVAMRQCPFCVDETRAKAVEETEYSFIVPNITQYDLWESHKVADHLLLMPKRHVEDIASLRQAERLDIMETIARYERQGYSVYARGVGSPTRSVDHQHTHLIKIRDGYPRIVLHFKKPYFLLRW